MLAEFDCEERGIFIEMLKDLRAQIYNKTEGIAGVYQTQHH